ncbi:hypothetical protein [Micromonospora sp. KC723]|uniref:hypothetical protein n=1 Tax=Micromonospora sp. KC723 TaxID=2530381 RepID=UPI00104AFBD2|nr:hypothetical protein [Micromonospora sp. KC723]TDB76703.1 hypothetical protein E1165_06040 [Micromonospora sp. KC723]
MPKDSMVVAFFAGVRLAVVRARAGVAFFAGVFFAGARVAGAFLARAGVAVAATSFFRAARAVVVVGFSPGDLAALAPVARLVAVAVFFAAAARFVGALRAPVAFRAPVGRLPAAVAFRRASAIVVPPRCVPAGVPADGFVRRPAPVSSPTPASQTRCWSGQVRGAALVAGVVLAGPGGRWRVRWCAGHHRTRRPAARGRGRAGITAGTAPTRCASGNRPHW